MDLRVFLEQIKKFGLEYFKIYPGFYRANVTRVDDPEARGRIQVVVPEIGHTKAPDTWVKPSFFGAGTDRGFFWPPEVGDSVFVAFMRGNPARPEFYIGGWYGNPKGKTEVPSLFGYDGKKPTKRGFVTRLGHSLLFDDTPGKQTVEIQMRVPPPGDAGLSKPETTAKRTGDYCRITMTKDGHIEIEDKNKNIAKMTKDGIEIEAKMPKILIKDPNKNEIEMSSKGVEIRTQQCKIIKDPDQSAVRGEDLQQWCQTHTHPTALGDTGPPVQPFTPTILSKNLKIK